MLFVCGYILLGRFRVCFLCLVLLLGRKAFGGDGVLGQLKDGVGMYVLTLPNRNDVCPYWID